MDNTTKVYIKNFTIPAGCTSCKAWSLCFEVAPTIMTWKSSLAKLDNCPLAAESGILTIDSSLPRIHY